MPESPPSDRTFDRCVSAGAEKLVAALPMKFSSMRVPENVSRTSIPAWPAVSGRLPKP